MNTIALPPAFAHKLNTCEGYVSSSADEYQKTKDKLTKLANTIFGNKPPYTYWTFAAPNAAVIQLDGNYFVVDTDDEESDDFVMDIMAKYGIVDNMTPSLSNYLLGKKTKNHYWFQLPENNRWTCITNFCNPKYNNGKKQSKEHSHLDLLGSKNRIIFENKECLDRLKNIPILSQEMLNDFCEYVPKVLLGDKMELQFQPIIKTIKPIIPIEEKSRVVLPQNIKDYIDETFTAEDSTNNDSFFFNSAHLLRKYGENAVGRTAVHYFAQKAGKNVYDRNKVDKWLDGTRVENMSPTYGMLKIKSNGKCIIQLDDDDLSGASTAVNSVVSTDTEDDQEVKVVKEDYIISGNEDRNFTTICEKIVPSIRKVLLYCRKEWYNYDDKTHLWSVIEEPQKIIKKYLFACIAANNTDVAIRLSKVAENDLATRATLVALQKQYLDMYKKIESLQVLTLVKRDLMVSLADDEFCNKLDQTSGKLVFKDGIYDIATNKFSKGLKYEYYLSYTLPYKYRRATALDKEEVQKKVMEICANEDWRFNYYMEILGYSMLGMPDKEQVAFFMVGMSAGNGKSTLLEALSKMMPNYVVNLNSKTFSKGNADFKKSINSVKGSRIAWINEVEKVKQDIDMIKQIADGKAIKNPVLFKQKEELIQIMAKLFFVSNGEIAFASDEGIKRRYRYVEFIAKFHTQQEHDALEEKREIDFVSDNAFAELLITEHGFFALLELILDGSRRWLETNSLVVPPEYALLAKAACEKNEEFAEFVANNIVKCVGKCIAKCQIEEKYMEKHNGRKMHNEKTDFRTYMAAKGFPYKSQHKKKVDGKVKDGCYMDCTFIKHDEVAIEEDEE